MSLFPVRFGFKMLSFMAVVVLVALVVDAQQMHVRLPQKRLLESSTTAHAGLDAEDSMMDALPSSQERDLSSQKARELPIGDGKKGKGKKGSGCLEAC